MTFVHNYSTTATLICTAADSKPPSPPFFWSIINLPSILIFHIIPFPFWRINYTNIPLTKFSFLQYTVYLRCNECQYLGVNIILVGFFFVLWKQSSTRRWIELVWKLPSGHTKVISDWCLWNNLIVVYTIINAYVYTPRLSGLHMLALCIQFHAKQDPQQILKLNKRFKECTGNFFLEIQFVRTWIWKCFNTSSEMSMTVIMTCMCVAS